MAVKIERFDAAECNAILVKGKVPKRERRAMKKEYGGHWSEDHGADTYPIENKNEIIQKLDQLKENLALTRMPEIIEVNDPYFELSDSEQKIDRLNQSKRITEKKGADKWILLTEMVQDFNKTCNRKLNPRDLKNLTEEDLQENSLKEREHLEILLEEYKKFNDIHEKAKDQSDRITIHESDADYSEKIFDYLGRNEVGDAEFFVREFGDEFVFDFTEGKNGSFFIFNGKYWEIDTEKKRYKYIDQIAEKYLEASHETDDKELKNELKKRAKQLRSRRRRADVFDTISALLPFEGSWDHVPGLLPCQNGVVDLETGELLSHKKDYFITKVCPVDYNPDAKSPLFEKFLMEITLNNEELQGFLQRLFGYITTGIPLEEIIVYFWGFGRNGKGTLVGCIEKTLGSLAHTFGSEMILLQRNPPSSSTPRPELAKLQGVRFAVFSEINKGRTIDSAQVKNLSGGDTISCRKLFSNIDLQIEPTHTLLLQTNEKPSADAEDKALWNRNVLIPFHASFVRNPEKENEFSVNEDLKEQLLQETEAILRWIVEGAIEYHQKGLMIPQCVRDETEAYRRENDGIGLFLEECCVMDPIFTTQKSKMTEAIKRFCSENGCEEPTRNEIAAYLRQRFGEVRQGKGSFWRGVKIEKCD